MDTKKMVRMSSKGQIVLPKGYRDKLDLNEGDYLMVDEVADGILVLAKSAKSLLDFMFEPLRKDAEAQGFTREELMDLIKSMRKERKADAA